MGEYFDAAKAERLGLVNEVVPADRLDARVREVADILASKDANPLVANVANGLLLAQIKAIVLTTLLAVVATTLIAYLVKAVLGLRPSEENEVSGLDLAEHGEEGYHSAGRL